MRILLTAVNAKYIHSNPAVRYLAAYAGEHAPSVVSGETEVLIREYTINQQIEQVMADIYRARPDMIGFSCYIWNMNYIEQLIRDLHQVLPDVPVWLGGPEVSFDAADILKRLPELTGVMVGEGEKVFCNLVEAYAADPKAVETGCKAAGRNYSLTDRDKKTGRSKADRRFSCLPAGIRGIVWRHPETGDIYAEETEEPMDLNEVPFFYASEPAEAFDNRVIYYESSRGCPFRCSYCLSSIDKKVRFRSTDRVLQELQFFLDRRVPQVKFVDRTFNCDHRHAQTIWRYIREHDNGITNFHFEIAADLLNEEELNLLSTLRPGQVQLEIGVQSTNPDTIREIDRVMDIDHLRKVVARIRAGRNIHQHLDLIIGLPEEGWDSFARSFNDVYAMEPDQFQVGFLKLLKGSAMHERREKAGIVCRRTAPYEVLSTNWLTYDEILRLKGIEEMVEVYYNSCQFTQTMKRLSQAAESPFALYRDLADYYESHGLNEGSHSRLERFSILRSFVMETGLLPIEEAEALLLLDLYLRENSRTRPEWAPDPSEGKEVFREHFRRLAGDKPDRRMLHGEVFQRDAAGFGGQGPWYVVFDYRNRDPLSGNAVLSRVDL